MANNRIVDPTQVGTSGLSGINTREGAARYFDSLGFSNSLSEYKVNKATRPIESPIQEVGVVGLNDSRLDKKMTSLSQLEDIEDARANIQPWYSKIGAGVGKGVVLAGTTFLDGIAGTIIGAVNGISNIGSDENLNSWQEFWSGFWDNPFSKAMQQVNDWSEQALPNYMSKEERDNILNGEGYKNMFNANWWGNSFLKNLGFSVGAFYSGNLISGALRGATPLVKTITGSVISAINEGKVEALNNADDWYKKELNKLNQRYEEELTTLEQNYGSSDIYSSLVENANNTYQEALAQLNSDKAKVGNVDLALNIPILTASNWFMWGKLYSGGAKTAINTTSIAKRNGKYVTNAGYKAVTGPLSEGAEEMEQKIAATIPQLKYSSELENFYTMRFSPNESRETIDWMQATMQGISDVVGDKNSWEEFAIGAMTGVLGMPSFRSVRNEAGKIQSPITLQGGLWESLDEYKRESSIVNELNSRVSDPKFSEYYQGLVRHNKYQSDMNNAALNGDIFQYKNAEDSQLISDIILFDKAGRLQDVEQMVNQAFDTSDENIDAIVKTTTDSRGNGPFSVDGNTKPKEEIINALTEQKDNILSSISNYRKIKDNINGILSGVDKQLTDPELEELIWLKSKSEAWNKRFNDLSEDVRMKFRTISAGYKIHHPDRSDIIDSMSSLLSLDNNSLIAVLNDKNNKGNIQIINKVVSDLSKGYNLDWKELSQDIKDLSLLSEYKDKADKKLIEYISNPDKLTEDVNKAKKKSDEANIEIDRKNAVDKINKASNFSDINNLLNSGEIASEDINNSTSDTAKSYEKANLFVKKALEYIDTNFSDKNKDLAKEAIQNRFNDSSNYSDLINPNLTTDFGLNYSLLDSKAQENFKDKFDKLLLEVANKITQGDNIKTPPSVKEAPKVDKPVGRDEIPQVPTSNGNLSTDEVKKSLDNIKLDKQIIESLKTTIDNINNTLDIYKESKNPNDARHIRTWIDYIINVISDNEIINKYLSKVESLIAKEPFIAGDLTSVSDDNAGSENTENYPETSVSNVMKAAIPQFDLNAKKNGLLIDFYSEEDNRNTGYAYVYTKLKEAGSDSKNAFDYVNEGNVKVGDSLDVRYEEEADNHPEIFWLYHNGHLVNALHADNSIEGADAIKKMAKDGLNPTVTVTKIMDGKFEYTRATNRSVKDIIGTDNVKLGIMKNGVMVANTEETIDAPFNSNNADGKVYILLPNSRGTLSPKQLQIIHFNNAEFTNYDSPIGRDVNSIIDALTNLSDIKPDKLEARLSDIFIDMVETFYLPDSFHIDTYTTMDGTASLKISFNDRNGNRVNRYSTLSHNTGRTITLFGDSDESRNAPIDKEALRKEILTNLQDANLAFNVDAKKIKGKNSDTYINKLVESGILRTYLTSTKMRGTWFLLNERPDSKHVDTFTAYKNERDARNSVRVMYNNTEFSVIDNVVYYQNGEIATLNPETELYIKDLAHIESVYGKSMYGVNQHNGLVLIEDANGKRGINRRNGERLNANQIQTLEETLSNRKPKSDKAKIAVKEFIQSQKNVRKNEDGSPKTDTGYYEILEEDEQYHQYERVHSVIGSNWSGTSTGDNAATGFGNMIDELVRQFFIDPSKIKRPENMDIKAYNNLIKALRTFKDTARSSGINIISDRLVVYKKYSNGKRIAGELDILSYNPFTGDISIIDTKTSKYSTKSSSFTNPTAQQTRSTVEQYTLQLSAYAKLFEDSFDFPISRLTLMPFNISYKDGELKSLNAEDFVRLNKNEYVFSESVPLKTYKGQYVTAASGKIEYHTADVREVLNLNGSKYYLTKIGDKYKLILPNGRSTTLSDDIIKDSMSEPDIKAALVQFINDVSESISKVLETDYLSSSPYGNSIIIQDESNSVLSKGIKAANLLNSLKPTEDTVEYKTDESVDKRESEDKKHEVTLLKNEVTARKSWNELSQDEKSMIIASFPSASESNISEIQKYWDSVDYIQREKIISCP